MDWDDLRVVILGGERVGKTQLRQRMMLGEGGRPIEFSDELSAPTQGADVSSRSFSRTDDFDGATARPIPTGLGGTRLYLWEPSPREPLLQQFVRFDRQRNRIAPHHDVDVDGDEANARAFFRYTIAALLVYDVASQDSFDGLQETLVEFVEAGGADRRATVVGGLGAAIAVNLHGDGDSDDGDDDDNGDEQFEWAPVSRSRVQNFPLVVVGTKCDLSMREVSQGEALQFAAEIGAEFMEVSAKFDSNVQKLTENLGLIAKGFPAAHAWTKNTTLVKSSMKR